MTLKTDILDDLDSILVDWDDILWNAVTFKGIFHNEYEAAILFSGEIDSKNPYVEIKDSDITDLVHDDILIINGTNYKVVGGPQPDGTGLSIVKLTLSEIQ